MGTTQPIRDKEDLKKFMDYYKTEEQAPRNYALITFGLYTALRISDILSLRWENIYDFEKQRFREHLFIQEQKTGKQSMVALNPHVTAALELYRKQCSPGAKDYLFTKSTTHEIPLSRSQAFRIVKKAAEHTLKETHISCHSLRKTFGYQAWKQGTPPALLMDIYNHSSYRITKKYLGISQDERDSVFLQMEL